MRIGILGGTFDPVHLGHLLLAELSREQCNLDQVWLVPAAVAPHKQDRRRAADEHRLAMLQLAVAGNPQLSVWDGEIRRGGVSYTADTLRELRDQLPESELFFLMGADSLVDLPSWREPDVICELATIVAVCRPGQPPLDFAPLGEVVDQQRIERFQRHVVDMPQLELSSTEIRRRVAASSSIRFQTPRSVEQYILHHGLYQ